MFSTVAIQRELSRREEFKNDYYLLSDEEMKHVTQELMDVFEVFDRLCKKHGLVYFLVAGSLIGAVRDKKLLPWDCDIDLVMSRKDLRRVGEILQSDEEFSKWEMLYPENATNFTLAAHFFRSDVRIDTFTTESLGSIPIYLDILPLENISNTGWSNFKKKMSVEALTAVYVSRRCFKKNDPLVNRMAKYSWKLWLNITLRKMIALPFAWVPQKTIFKMLDKVLDDDTEYEYVCIPFGAKRFSGEIFRRSSFYPASTEMLDGIAFMAPHHPDEYLEHRYGDYMTPPSADEIREQLLIAKEQA